MHSPAMDPSRALIIGGGAAGLMAGALLPDSLILERLPQAGRRILVTGGGRCNLTHDGSPSDLAKAFRREAAFVKPALQAFPPTDQRRWFEDHGVPTKVEPGGFVFPQSDQAASVRNALLQAVEEAHTEIRCTQRVSRICVENGVVAGVDLADGTHLPATCVLLAAGGAAQPSLGTDGASLSLAQSAGLPTVPQKPALGAIFFQGFEFLHYLAGLTLPEAQIHLLATSQAGTKHAPQSRAGLLFTGAALSGPCVMNLCGEASALLVSGAQPWLRIAWNASLPTPEAWLLRLQADRQSRGTTRVLKFLSEQLPRSLSEALLFSLHIHPDTPLSRLRKEETQGLCQACGAFLLPIARTESLKTCKGSIGGVQTQALSRSTLESRAVRGLYCLGEAVDVMGDCGGYNLAWAWASAFLASRHVLGGC